MTKKLERVVCPWCNHVEDLSDGRRDVWFTWANIKNQMLYLCWNCTDKLHSTEIARERLKEKLINKKS